MSLDAFPANVAGRAHNETQKTGNQKIGSLPVGSTIGRSGTALPLAVCRHGERAVSGWLTPASSLAGPEDAAPHHLRSGINQADSMFVDRYQEAFRVIWISSLLKRKVKK